MARVVSSLVLLFFALCLVEKTSSKDLHLEDVLGWMDKLQEIQVRIHNLESNLSVICIAAMLTSFSCANLFVLLDEAEIFVNVKNIFSAFRNQ